MPLDPNIKVVASKRITQDGKPVLGLFGYDRRNKSKKLKLVDTRNCKCPKDDKKPCDCGGKKKNKFVR